MNVASDGYPKLRPEFATVDPHNLKGSVRQIFVPREMFGEPICESESASVRLRCRLEHSLKVWLLSCPVQPLLPSCAGREQPHSLGVGDRTLQLVVFLRYPSRGCGYESRDKLLALQHSYRHFVSPNVDDVDKMLVWFFGYLA